MSNLISQSYPITDLYKDLKAIDNNLRLRGFECAVGEDLSCVYFDDYKFLNRIYHKGDELVFVALYDHEITIRSSLSANLNKLL